MQVGVAMLVPAGHDRRRARKRLGGCLRTPNVSQVHRSAVRRAHSRRVRDGESEVLRIAGGIIGDDVVLLEIAQELVKGNRRSRQDPEIDSNAIGVRRVAGGLIEVRYRAAIRGEETGSLVAIAGISQPDLHR